MFDPMLEINLKQKKKQIFTIYPEQINNEVFMYKYNKLRSAFFTHIHSLTNLCFFGEGIHINSYII